MKVEVLISFNHFKRGQQIELPDGVANVRINRGFCKCVDEPVKNKMVATPKRKK